MSLSSPLSTTHSTLKPGGEEGAARAAVNDLDDSSLYLPHTFPRWGAIYYQGTTNNERDYAEHDGAGGIDFDALLEFVLAVGSEDGHGTARSNAEPPHPAHVGDYGRGNTTTTATTTRSLEQIQADIEVLRAPSPEVVYVWGSLSTSPPVAAKAAAPGEASRQGRGGSGGTDGGTTGGGVWVSRSLRERVPAGQRRNRALPIEKFLQRIFLYLAGRSEDLEAQRRWPLLLRTMTSKPTDQHGGAGGFPFVVWHGDNWGCNLRNYQSTKSIPVLTTCSPVNCSHSIPFPTYRTIRDAEDWADTRAVARRLREQSLASPWSAKIRKLVWRGALSGRLLNFTSPRSRLGEFAAEHRSHPLLDVGISSIPARHFDPSINRTTTVPPDLTERILMKPKMPMENFSNYKAILDTDGNSWSSRFGQLLCTDSVILKVEPHFVDYFYRNLHPWKHYIPVRYDLSDLINKAEWALDPANQDKVLQIIASANRWCRTHMNRQAVMYDGLDVLNAYVSFLDRGNPNWPRVWRTSCKKLWNPSSGLEMRRV